LKRRWISPFSNFLTLSTKYQYEEKFEESFQRGCPKNP